MDISQQIIDSLLDQVRQMSLEKAVAEARHIEALHSLKEETDKSAGLTEQVKALEQKLDSIKGVKDGR